MRAKLLFFVLSAGLTGLMASQPAAQTPVVPVADPQAIVPVVAPMPPAPPARQLELTFHGDGTVTLLAQSVSVREILNEWSRRGGSVMQGAEKLMGGPSPTPLRFTKQPEAAVLESLLRSAAGVILMPRIEGARGASRLDVTILATSNATAMYGGSPAMQTTSSPMPTGGFPNSELPPVPGVQPQPGPSPQQQQQAPPPPSRPGNVVPITPVTPVPVTPVGPGTSTPPPTGRGGGGGGAR